MYLNLLTQINGSQQTSLQLTLPGKFIDETRPRSRSDIKLDEDCAVNSLSATLKSSTVTPIFYCINLIRTVFSTHKKKISQDLCRLGEWMDVVLRLILLQYTGPDSADKFFLIMIRPWWVICEENRQEVSIYSGNSFYGLISFAIARHGGIMTG